MTAARSARDVRGSRGVVLVLVLVVTAILAIAVLDLFENTLVAQQSTHNGDRRTVAFYNARSAVQLGRLALVLQGLVNSQMGGGQPGQAGGIDVTPWSGILFDMFSSSDTRNTMLEAFAGIPSDLVTGFAELDGDFSVTVVDEDGRVNLNLAAQGDESQQWVDRVLSWLIAPAEYDELFGGLGPDEQITTREQLVADAIDWADTNEQLYARAGASAGAEDNVYETLPEPYARKDSPYDSVDELRLVRGVGDDFWRTFVDPDPSDPDRRTLTVWGQGKINVNAAPPRVLAAVICALASDPRACDPGNFERVLLLAGQVAEMTGGRFGSPIHFVRAVGAGTEEAPGIAIDASLADKWLTTVGKVFSVYVVGTAPVAGRPGTVARTRRAPAPSHPPGTADAGAGGAVGGRQEVPPAPPSVTVRLHVVIDTTPPWDSQGGRVLYWREL